MGATAKTIVLKGDKRNPESAEYNIEFPGGSLSVCRTTDGQYWAHVWVYTENKGPLFEGVIESKHGKIECVRVDTPNGVKLLNHENTDHFAVLISTKG